MRTKTPIAAVLEPKLAELDSSSDTRIDAAILIPGRGEPISNATLIIRKQTIHHISKTSALPSSYTSLTPLSVPVLMPGMWDCHVHFFGITQYTVAAGTTVHPALAGARSARDLAATLNAGFTSVREMAGYGIQLAQAVNEGWLPGPNIYSAGSMLSPTAGHADDSSCPLEQLVQTQRTGDRAVPFWVCDGVDECVKAVRVMTRRGASVIKIATSGGVSSSDDPMHQKFSSQEVRAIVDEADRADMIVAAHCHGERGVGAAVEGGCGTLEHGSFLCEVDGAYEDMKDKGTVLIPTRSAMEFGVANPGAWSEEAYQQLLVVNKAARKSYQEAIKAGVKVALGTDLGLSSEEAGFKFGTNGSEFKYAVKEGMTPLEAVEAGTAMGRETLGAKRAERIKKGQLKVGWDADVIALSKNPLDDIEILGNSDCVTYVWKGGKLVKRDGRLLSP